MEASHARSQGIRQETRKRILDAALETLRREGYSGTSARTIARVGDFNQALIFYHFGSINDLLLAAVDSVSAERLARYREAIDPVETIPEFARVAAALYREDMESGRTTVLAEMVAATLATPELAPQLMKRMEPWFQYAEAVIDRILRATPFEGIASARELAEGVVALYMGMEVMTHLDGDRSRFDPLFALGQRLAEGFEMFFGRLDQSGARPASE